MANDIQSKNVNIYLDDAPARDAYQRLEKKADDYNRKIDEGARKSAVLSKQLQLALDAGGKPEGLKKRLEAVNATLETNRKQLVKVTDQQKALQQQLDSRSGPSLRSQEQLVTKLWNEYKRLGQNTDEAKIKLQEYVAAGRQLDGMRDRVNQVRGAQEGAAKSSSNFMASFGGNLLATGVAKATSVVVDFFNGAVDEALEAEESTARFAATLGNLGRMDVFDRLMAKANEMAERFKYLDNDEIVGVFNKLIDYGKLTESQMNALLPVIIDFAAKQRISITEASSVIVKSLEGNGKALKEYGINLKDAGTPAERLTEIMTTLKSKVDGAGEAFMQTAKGGIAVAKQDMANLKEEVGNGFIPVLSMLLNMLNTFMGSLKMLSGGIRNSVSDIKILFTEGTAAVDKARADRAKAEMDGLLGQASKNLVSQFASKTANEIYAEIDRLTLLLDAKQKAIAAKQRGIKEGFGNDKDRADIKQYTQDVQVLQGALKNLSAFLEKPQGGTIGINGGESEKKGKPARDPKVDQVKKDQEELQKFLQQKAFELSQFDLSEREKELNRLAQTYEEKRKLAHGNKALLLSLEEKYWQDILQVNIKYGRENLATLQKQEEEARKAREAAFNKFLADTTKRANEIKAFVDGQIAKGQQQVLDKLQLAVLQNSGKARLDAQKAQLEEQQRREIVASNGTAEAKQLIEEQYRLKGAELDRAYIQQRVDEYTAYAQQAASIVTSFINARNAQESAELNRELKQYERRAAADKKLYNSKLISQQEYNKRVAEQEDAADRKRHALEVKQFERNKKLQIAQALMNGASAVTKILAEYPKFDFGVSTAIGIGLALATTAAQVGEIGKQKPPEFAKGGVVQGASHAQGGVAMIDSRSGRKVGEMEGGEPYLILSKKTYGNNKQVIDALLHSSTRRNGAKIDPWYKTRPYKSFDHGGVTKTIQTVRYFENGGVYNSRAAAPEAASNAPAPVVVPAMSPEQEALMQQLLAYLKTPSKNYVLLADIEAARLDLATIQDDALFG